MSSPIKPPPADVKSSFSRILRPFLILPPSAHPSAALVISKPSPYNEIVAICEEKGVKILIWKLLSVNFIFFILATLSNSRLRASLNRLTTDYDNTLTYLCTKNSVSIIYNFVWIVALLIASFISVSVYALVITAMALMALSSLFRLLSHCTPGKRERILLESREISGYRFLIFVLLLVFLSRASSYLIVAGIF